MVMVVLNSLLALSCSDFLLMSNMHISLNNEHHSFIIAGIHMREINPCHSYLGCLPSFSSYNRCMMCHSCGVDGPECEGNLDNGSSSW